MSHAVSVVLLLFCLFWIDAADAQRAPPKPPSWSLSVSEGRLTADINRIPLRVVLEELARQVPLRLWLSEGARDHSVTAQFRALPLDAALQRLLDGFSYAIVYDHAPPGQGSAAERPIVELLVLEKAPVPRSAGSSAAAVVSNAGQGQDTMLGTTPEWTAALRHPDQRVRLDALQRWAVQGAATPLNPLMHALVDPDESVRAKAQELVEQVWATKADSGVR